MLALALMALRPLAPPSAVTDVTVSLLYVCCHNSPPSLNAKPVALEGLTRAAVSVSPPLAYKHPPTRQSRGGGAPSRPESTPPGGGDILRGFVQDGMRADVPLHFLSTQAGVRTVGVRQCSSGVLFDWGAPNFLGIFSINLVGVCRFNL